MRSRLSQRLVSVGGRVPCFAAALLSLVGCSGAPETAAKATRASSLPEVPSDLVYSRTLAEGRRALCVIPAGGGAERRLTDGSASDGLPRWTPDGRAVIFSSNRSGRWQLWRVSADGGQPTRLRTNDCNESQGDLSPDGTTLAFLSDCGGPQSLWLASPADGEARLLVRHRRRTVFGNPQWNRDGRRIVYSSNHSVGHQIQIVDVASGEQERLSGLLSGGCEPRFSPDGRKVVHVSRGHRRKTSDLVETEIATGGERILVKLAALNYGPVYAPDGSEIAFASNLTGEYQIYRMRLPEGTPVRVTSPPGEAREPDYRPR